MKKSDLIIFMEEAGEIVQIAGEMIQTAAKAIRFGVDEDYHGTGTNRQKLEMEVGDLLAMVDRLRLDQSAIEMARLAKHEKLKKYGPEAIPIIWDQ